jgi:hypothetical protein
LSICTRMDAAVSSKHLWESTAAVSNSIACLSRRCTSLPLLVSLLSAYVFSSLHCPATSMLPLPLDGLRTLSGAAWFVALQPGGQRPGRGSVRGTQSATGPGAAGRVGCAGGRGKSQSLLLCCKRSAEVRSSALSHRTGAWHTHRLLQLSSRGE